MSDTQGDQPVSAKSRIILGLFAALIVAAAAVFIGVTAHNAQVQADAKKAMTAAAPAYQGAISLGGDLDQLSSKSVQAKAAFDAEQQRLAAEKAAAEAAAAQAAAAAAAQAAADEAARQAQQQAASDDSSSGSGDTGSSGPVKCPAGTHAMAVDDQGNESNCDPLNSQGQQCVAYDANNQCTAWLEQ